MHRFLTTSSTFMVSVLILFCLLCQSRASHTVLTDTFVTGEYCIKESYLDLINIPQHLCVHRCMTASGACAAVNYDTQHHQCSLLSVACGAHRPKNASFVYIALKPPPDTCLTWIPHVAGASYPDNNITVNGFLLGRASYGDDALLIGTIYPDEDVIRFRVDGLHTEADYEVAVVDPTCVISWRYWTITKVPSLPENAVAGGYMDGREVFVGRWGAGGTKAYGYYDVGVKMYFRFGTMTFFDLLTASIP